MRKKTGALALLLVAYAAAAAAQACEDGQVLNPGESCIVTVKWGHDHTITGAFPANGENYIEFSHVEGQCNVALFGPAEGLLGPDQPPLKSAAPGEYHLFTRAITVAKQTCRYRVAVD
ncbi:MAG: hypothetical protein ACE5GS_01475 [Kiloniellaceae bacterium]